MSAAARRIAVGQAVFLAPTESQMGLEARGLSCEEEPAWAPHKQARPGPDASQMDRRAAMPAGSSAAPQQPSDERASNEAGSAQNPTGAFREPLPVPQAQPKPEGLRPAQRKRDRRTM